MLFPQLGPQYYDTKGKGILSRMEAFYAESITINQSFWSEADTDTRFIVGDQSLWSDLYGNLPSNRRRQFNFNRILRVINMIDGFQRRNRKSTVAIPYENGDNDTADQYSKVLMWCNQQDSVLETISTAFRGSLITGMNLLQVWVDYRHDPVSGSIKVDCKSYNEFLIDPYFKKQDLSDCNAIWTRKFLTKREVISLLPDNAEEILGLIGNSNGTGRDGKFQFEPESYNYGMKNLLTYDEFYYRDYRTQKMLVDSQTGETMEWKSQDDNALQLFLANEPTVTVVEQDIPTVRLAIVVEGKVMYDGPNPLGDKYPFVPVFAYYYPECPYFPWRIQGVVRGLRDSQYLYNRRKIIELDILESQITSGFKYKENALVNPKDIFLQGQGRGLALKDEAQMTDVEQILPPQIPPSMLDLSKLLGEEISQISGVNEELLGSATDEKAGILSMLRQGAGLTTLQILFDNLDHAQKLLGNLMLDIIQANFTPGKVKKILEGEEPQPQFYNQAFGKYNVVIEEGLNTTTQKQMNFAQLLELKQIIPDSIPDDVLLEASTLQDKKKLLEAVQQKMQAQQQAEQQAQELQMAQIQSQIKSQDALSVANEGLGLERVSRVQENQALAEERRAKAIHDEDSALLDKIKALKELETLDFSHIRELIEMAHLLENQTLTKEQHRHQMSMDVFKANNEKTNTAQNGSVAG